MILSDILIGQYLPGETLVHRLDPRSKILIVLTVGMGLFLVDLPGYLVFVLVLAGIYGVAQIPPSFVWRGVRPVLLFLIFTVLFHLFGTAGEPLFRLGPLTATREGVIMGIAMGLRLLLLVLVASVLSLTTSPISLTDGLERLLRPARVVGFPAHEIAMMISIALRFIPTLGQEAERILKAQMARGATLDRGGLLARIKAMVPILIPLFVGAFRRAEDLAVAMEARGYRGGEGRTSLRELHWQIVDTMALGGTVIFVVGLAWFF